MYFSILALMALRLTEEGSAMIPLKEGGETGGGEGGSVTHYVVFYQAQRPKNEVEGLLGQSLPVGIFCRFCLTMRIVRFFRT